MSFLDDVEAIGKKIETGLVTFLRGVEHEIPKLLSALVDIYGPSVVANAIATHKGAVQMYADKGIDIATADTKAFVQSTIVQKFGLPPTAAQFIASGIQHVFTIGEAKVNSLIDQGAASAIADVTANPTTPPTA